MKVQSWNDLTGCIFLKRSWHDIKPQLQANTWMRSPGEIFQSWNTAFTAGGRCLHQWSKQQYDIFSIENGSTTTDSSPLGQWKKLNEEKNIIFWDPLKMLIYWQYEIYSHHGRCIQNQVLFSVLSLNLCVSFAMIGCEADVLAMWRESKELLISSKRAVNFFWDLTISVFLSRFFSLHFYWHLSRSFCVSSNYKEKQATYCGRFRAGVVCYWWVNLRSLAEVVLKIKSTTKVI